METINGIKVLEDLGTIYPTGSSPKSYRMLLVECQKCRLPVKVRRTKVNTGKPIQCTSCAHKGFQNVCKKTTADYIKDLKVARGDLTVLEQYVGNKHKILHEHTCGHKWKIAPSNALNNSGCPRCTKYGFKEHEPAILYYFRVEKEDMFAWKIGITNNTLPVRYPGNDRKCLHDIRIWKFSKGIDAKRIEQELVSLYKECKYNGLPLLETGGNSELFYTNIIKEIECYMESHSHT